MDGSRRGKAASRLPVYVLIGPGTVSGAGDLAFIFRSTGRGILVAIVPPGAGREQLVSGRRRVSGVRLRGRTFDREGKGVGARRHRAGYQRARVTMPFFAVTRTALKKLAGPPTLSAAETTDFVRENLEARGTRARERRRSRAACRRVRQPRVVLDGGKLYYTREGSVLARSCSPSPTQTFALGEGHARPSSCAMASRHGSAVFDTRWPGGRVPRTK